MTREEVIHFLGQLQRILIKSNSWKDAEQAINEAFGMAIEAIKSTQSNASNVLNALDTIYRQAAIDAVSRGCQEFRGVFAECEKNLKELPSAQPEIIRCEKCEHYTALTGICEVRGKGLRLIRRPDDFCSRAERREEWAD